MKLFLESIQDTQVIEFILSNLKKDGLDELFDMLNYCNEDTQDRWHNIYYELMKNAF